MIKFIGTAQKNQEVILFFLQQEGDNTFFKSVTSSDGFIFDNKSSYIFALDTMQQEEQHYHWNHLRGAKENHTYMLTYKNSDEGDSPLYGAFSADLAVWQKVGQLEGISETGTVIPKYQYQDSFVMYTGEHDIRIAFSEDLITWKVQEKPLLSPRSGFFDDSALEVANVHQFNNKILLIYYVKKTVNNKDHFLVGAAYFDKHDPSKLLWRSEEPLYEQHKEFSQHTIQPLGSVILNDELILYWSVDENSIFSIACPIPLIRAVPRKNVFTLLIKKAKNNPIISPQPHVPWESRATFNSAAIYEDGKVHFLYRALGDTDLSVLGYATSSDGTTIDFRSDTPAYIPREPFETPGNKAFSSLAQHFVSGGGYGGIEDPRITRINDTIFLTYVAFDGATPPRAAMSSISVEDFKKNNWDAWKKPKLISAPGMVNKSAVVLPRKVRGKYVVLHRVYPNILVDYLDDLEFNEYLRGDYFIPPRKNFWDSKKVGAGAPPMETKDGWLLVYQSVGYQDPSRYKIGAMILDRNNPEKVLYRTHVPIIEPVEHYENNGFKAGVVYPCGAVIMNEKLYIYYGGADSYLNAASTELEPFLWEMKHHREPKVRMVQIPIN